MSLPDYITVHINTTGSTRAETTQVNAHNLTSLWMKRLPFSCFSFSSTFCFTVGIFYQIRKLLLKSIFHLSPFSYSGTLAALSSPTCDSPHLFLWAWGFRPKQLIFSVAFLNPSQHILHGLTNPFTVPYPSSYRCEFQVYPCKYVKIK